MNEVIDSIFDFLLSSGIDVRLIIVIIAILPIAEARLALPFALKCGLSPFEAFAYSFLGSSLAVPFLLLFLIPLIKFLASTKLFKKLGQSLLDRFSDKADGISAKTELKKLLGVAAFVAIPLPLTGVWTGSAIAAILMLNYTKSILAIICGNLVASAIILVITLLFSEYINLIMAVFALIAIIVVISMLLKALKPSKQA